MSPHNVLYYEMMAKFKEILREKEYESPQLGKSQVNRKKKKQRIPLEEKCQYTFCCERRYMVDDKKELFCSKKCKKLFEEIFV